MSENLLTILPDLEVTSDEVREAEAMAQQYLSALFPTVDFRQGLAVYDQVIRPNATLIALVTKGLEVYFTNNSKEGITDDSPEDFVDKLMSNHFLTRRTGTTSTVSARLYFLQKKTVFLSESYFFSTNNEEFFFPVENKNYSSEDMKESLDGSLAPYYLDVEMVAESSGDRYDIEGGGLLYFSIFDPYFVGGEILFLKEKSVAKESNTEFVARTESSVSTRNLINNPSIQERILSIFNFISEVQPIGHSDFEMIRDIRTVVNPSSGLESQVHLGGMVDVYFDAQRVQGTQVPVVIELDANGNTGFYVDGPIYNYSSAVPPSEAPATVTGDDAFVTPLTAHGSGTYPRWGKANPPLDIVGYDYNTGTVDNGDYSLDNGYSAFQRSWVPVPNPVEVINSDGSSVGDVAIEAGTYFYINVEKFLGVESVQSYLDDADIRVITADYMARAMDVYVLSFDINTFNTATAQDATAIRPFLEAYVKELGPGGVFTMSDLIVVLREKAGVENLVIPVGVTYDRYTHNGNVEFGVSIDDVKDIDRISGFDVGSITKGTTEVAEVDPENPLIVEP